MREHSHCEGCPQNKTVSPKQSQHRIEIASSAIICKLRSALAMTVVRERLLNFQPVKILRRNLRDALKISAILF
jgi:hypothetical protein